jgi:hypothetical protein
VGSPIIKNKAALARARLQRYADPKVKLRASLTRLANNLDVEASQTQWQNWRLLYQLVAAKLRDIAEVDCQ